jgi:hypothetical protein
MQLGRVASAGSHGTAGYASGVTRSAGALKADFTADRAPGPTAATAPLAPRGPQASTARGELRPDRITPGATNHGPGAHQAPDGVDLGWLAACLGLVAAATVLGRVGGGRDVTPRRRTGLAALLRPMPRRS